MNPLLGGVLREGQTNNFLAPTSAWSVIEPGMFDLPWPTGSTPARGLGYLAPYDEQFVKAGGDVGPFIGWQQDQIFSHSPWWNDKQLIAATKRQEYDLFVESPHSRMQELQQFTPAFVTAPPPFRYRMPDAQPSVSWKVNT